MGSKRKNQVKKLAMIPNGCDLELVNGVIESVKNKKFIAVFTGAHGFANGLDAVLDAANSDTKR